MNILAANLGALLNREGREMRGEPEPSGPPKPLAAFKTVVTMEETKPTPTAIDLLQRLSDDLVTQDAGLQIKVSRNHHGMLLVSIEGRGYLGGGEGRTLDEAIGSAVIDGNE